MIGWVFRANPQIRRWVLILYWVVMFLATHWPNIARYRPKEGWPLPYFDVVMHVGIYTIWAGLWIWVLGAHGAVRWRTFVGLFVLGILYAVFDEWTQALVQRTPTFDDLGSNLLGMGIGSLGTHLIALRFGRLSRGGDARNVPMADDGNHLPGC